MEFHRRLLRAMLWLLALAAAAGIAAIFFATHVMARVGGTAFVCAVGLALAMPASRSLDDEKSRPGGLVSLTSIVIGFVLAASAIWVELFVGWRWQERFAFTAFVVTAAGMTAGVLLPRATAPKSRYAALGGLLTDVLAAVLFLIAIWSSSGDEYAQTGGFLLGSGVLGSVCLIGLGSDSPAWRWLWRWLGVAGAAAGLVLGFLGVWYVHTHDPTWYIVAMSAALVVAYTNVLVRLPLGANSSLVRLGAIGSLGAAGALLSTMSFITSGFNTNPDELLIKITGACAVGAACAAMSVVILYRLNRRLPSVKENLTHVTAVVVICPHCDRKHSAAMGESACPGCGLVFTLKVHEPRCVQCDYPLLGIKGAVCPECGTSRQPTPILTP